jgi:hypothetical protein
MVRFSKHENSVNLMNLIGAVQPRVFVRFFFFSLDLLCLLAVCVEVIVTLIYTTLDE